VWQYLPVRFLQCSVCHSSGVRTRVLVEETEAFAWSASSFWTKGWLYSVFKKLRIISCVNGSLLHQKTMNRTNREFQKTLATTFPTEGVVFACFQLCSAFFKRLTLVICLSPWERFIIGFMSESNQNLSRFHVFVGKIFYSNVLRNSQRNHLFTHHNHYWQRAGRYVVTRCNGYRYPFTKYQQSDFILRGKLCACENKSGLYLNCSLIFFFL
jgi:hypothetical protein